MKRVTGVKYMVTEDQTTIGEHRMRYTDVVLYSCTAEICGLLLTSVTSITSIKKETLICVVFLLFVFFFLIKITQIYKPQT